MTFCAPELLVLAFWESPTKICRPHGPHVRWFWHVKRPEVLLFLLRLESLQSFPICSMEINELTWRHCDSAVKELQDFENQVDSTFEVDKCACMRCMGASAMAPVATQIQKLVDECTRADCADCADGARPFVSRSSASISSFFSLASSFLLATWARLVRFKASCSLQRWQNSQALPLWQPSALKEKKRQGVHLPSACILCIAKRGIGTALGSGTRSPSELTSRLSVFPAMAELPLVRPKDWQRCFGMLLKPSHFYPSSLGATCSYGWIRKFLTGRRFEKPAKVDGQMRKQPSGAPVVLRWLGSTNDHASNPRMNGYMLHFDSMIQCQHVMLAETQIP